MAWHGTWEQVLIASWLRQSKYLSNSARHGATLLEMGTMEVRRTVSWTLDQKLLLHLQDIVEVIVVDEADNEAKAADIGRGRRASAMELEPITPNLKFVARDKAHAYRRNLHKFAWV